MAFDPDAYLAKSGPPAAPKAFDPDAYLDPPPTVGQGRAARLGLESGVTLGGSTVLRGVAGADPLKGLDGGRFDRTPGPRELERIYPGMPYSEAASRWFNANRPDLAAAGGADRTRTEQRGRYLVSRDAARREMDSARDQNPWTVGLSEVLGGVATAPLAGVGTAARGVPLLARMGQGARGGAKIGATAGLLTSRSDTLGGEVSDTALGSLAGTGIGGVAPAVAQGVKSAVVPAVRSAGEKTLRLLTPNLRVDPAAAELQTAGVQGLTTGLKAPGTFVGRLEAMSADGAGGMGPEREAAAASYRSAVLRRATDDADKVPLPTDVNEATADLYQRFGPRYDAIRNVPVPAEAVAGLSEAAAMPRKGVDARTIAGVKTEVDNALTVLGAQPKPGPPSGLVDQFGSPVATPAPTPRAAKAGDLMKVRENIREQIRAARQSQDWDRLRLLEGAEDVVTESLDSALTPEAQAANRATDALYAKFNVVEDAVSRGGLDGNFSPRQLGAAVKKSAGRRAFAQGGGGDLRDLASAGARVFDAPPKTGFVNFLAGVVPKSVAPGVSRLNNSPTMQAALFGTPMPWGQVAPAGSLPGPVRGVSPQMKALIDAMRLRVGGPAPVPADEETSR